ncbi:hypothetical protein HY641_00520 [Candidatus Woesearchaeota archaeon]|nr:hypothetical protein [Candidatus Woesearchaeota archaeon]
MVNVKRMGLALMITSVVLFLIGFGYVRSVESALLANHEVGEQGECLHEETVACPYVEMSKLAFPKFAAFLVDLGLFGVGLYLYLQKSPQEKAAKHARSVSSKLGGEERKIVDLLLASQGMAFQHEIVRKLEMSKVKVTRLLDKLEHGSLIERRRRGMTNLVVLK